jgi:hypothetical protein
VARLEYGFDANRELLPAVAALLQAKALNPFRVLLGRLRPNALENVNPILAAAIGANWIFRPKKSLDLLEGRLFVVKVLFVENRYGSDPVSR